MEIDRFTFAYGLAIGVVLIYGESMQEIVYIFGQAVPLTGLFLLMMLGSAIFLLQALVRHVWSRRWRRIVSLIVAPFVVMVGHAELLKAGVDASWLRFCLLKSTYMADVAKLPDDPEFPKLLAWRWDLAGPAQGYGSEATMVYDESDELGRPGEQHSLAWRQRMWASQFRGEGIAGFRLSGGSDNVEIRQIEGHFYLVREKISD